MRKDLMKDGNSYKIRITKKEMELYNLKEGDIIEVRINKIKKK
jgi:antitoxin component of MazEF toxin-antitoxin module